jgi:hypothetical protein
MQRRKTEGCGAFSFSFDIYLVRVNLTRRVDAKSPAAVPVYPVLYTPALISGSGRKRYDS